MAPVHLGDPRRLLTRAGPSLQHQPQALCPLLAVRTRRLTLVVQEVGQADLLILLRCWRGQQHGSAMRQPAAPATQLLCIRAQRQWRATHACWAAGVWVWWDAWVQEGRRGWAGPRDDRTFGRAHKGSRISEPSSCGAGVAHVGARDGGHAPPLDRALAPFLRQAHRQTASG
jgi:hypothetical protein